MNPLYAVLLWALLVMAGFALLWGRDQYQRGFKAGYKQHSDDEQAQYNMDYHPTYGNDT